MDHDKPVTIAAAVALSCIGIFGLLPQPLVVGALQDTLGFSSQQAGLITAAEVFGGALASICAAFWIQRVNWRLAALFAIAVVVLGNLLSSFQQSYLALLALRGAVGFLGEGTAFAVAISVISNTSETDRNFAYSIAAQVAFGVVAFATLPTAVAGFGLGGILIPLAAIALLIAPLVRWLPAASSRQHDAAVEGAAASVGPAVLALGILLIWCIGLGGIYAFEERIGVAGGLEPTRVGGALAVAVALGFLGAMSASWVADRWGRILPVSVALLAQVGAIALLQGELSWIQFAIFASVFHFFWNFTGPYLMGMVASSDETGRIAVLMPAAQTGGFAAGTALAGNLMTDSSMLAANGVAIAGCLIALVLFVPTALAASRRQVRPAEA
jgi:predicted MFS family arabinose efflux permease